MSSSKENRKIENRISIDAEKTIKIIVESSAITTAFFGMFVIEIYIYGSQLALSI